MPADKFSGMDTPAKRIQWALEQRAIGVRELARRLGVSPGLPSQWWRTRGRATSPDSHLDDIAEVLAVNVDWLRYARGEPFAGGAFLAGRREIGSPLDTACARIVGTVEGEVWREGNSMREAIAAADGVSPTLQVVARRSARAEAIRSRGSRPRLRSDHSGRKLCHLRGLQSLAPSRPSGGRPGPR